MLTAERIWQILDEVKDPEIPVVSVVEMGLIRSIGVQEGRLVVTISPTFAGCPALQVIQEEIAARLRLAGEAEVEVRLTYSPPWRSDWITPAARQKLKAFGLSPPPRHAGRLETALAQAARCPYCDSADTTLKNDFGPTLCRAIYVCNNCRQPFEQFKPL
jgi:ring-1,2-phenylacetyl-CoA epoxidase subunit PaaD